MPTAIAAYHAANAAAASGGERPLPRHSASSRSSPALSAAFNLKQFSTKRRPLAMETITTVHQFPHENKCDRERRRKLAEVQAQWRQREEDERGIEAARAKAEAKAAEAVAEQRKAELEAKRTALLRAQVAAWQAEKAERERRIAEQEAKVAAEKAERERLRVEEEERERLRRMPWTCQDCGGSGGCQACGGEGCTPGLYLSCASVHDRTLKEYGMKPQGCQVCLGWAPGIHGKFVKGTGKCQKCGGRGKIWPVVSPRQRNKKKTSVPMARSPVHNDATVESTET